MAQVMMPEKKKSALSQILPIGAAAAGAFFGSAAGPAGALKGASAGYGMGSTAAGVVEDATATSGPQPLQASTSPIDRRMDKMNADPFNTLSEAKQSLAYMPADVKERYQKPIDDAYGLALEQRRKNQQMGVA